MSKILNKIFVFDPAWVYTFIQVGFIPKIKQCFNNIKIRLASRKKWIDFPYYFHKIQLKTFNTIYKINTYKVLQVGEMAYWLVTLDTKHNTVLSFLGFVCLKYPKLDIASRDINGADKKNSKENLLSLAEEPRKGQATRTETFR